MTHEQALDMIKQALDETGKGLSSRVSASTDLVNDQILDSLDTMNFLFELEKIRGNKIDAIDDTFDDFRVSTIMDLLVAG
jgi:acyl carrier protein